MKIVHDLPQEMWRRFVETHPYGNIFHTPEMFHVWTRTRGHTPEIWAAIEDDAIRALLLPVNVTLRNGFAQRLTSRAVAYGDILVAPGADGPRALEGLFAAYRQSASSRVLFTELRQHNASAANDPALRAAGLVEHKYLNYLIDLRRSPEQVFESIGARTRKHLRRRLRAGRVRVSSIETRDRLDDWYAILTTTYARAGVPLADISLFYAAFELLHPRGLCRFWLAEADSAPAACSVELLYKQRIVGWYGGTDRTWGHLTPNELLTWHILEWGAQQGFTCYDFGGAGRAGTAYAVRDFKSKFGGQLVDESRMVCVHSPRAMALSELGYRLLARVLFGRTRHSVRSVRT